jgi:hypothetical protein
MNTGDVVYIDFPGNNHNGARCVYLGPWDSGVDRGVGVFHGVIHLHGSVRADSGHYWYTKGQETYWDRENLYPTGEKASFCAGCDQWFVGEGYLCQFCEES